MTATEETNNATIAEDNTTKTPNTRHIVTLVAGDTLAFLAFAAIGRNTHGEATGLAAIQQIIQTAALFAIAWFVVAPFVGVYRRDLVANPRKMAKCTVIAWVLS